MTARDRNMLVGFVVVLLLGAFWMFALSPRRSESADVAAQVEAAQQQRDDAAAQAAIARTAKQEFDTDFAIVAKLGKAVPAVDDTASLLYQLQDAAGRSRVFMQAISTTGVNGAPAGNAAAAGTTDPATGTPGPAGVTAMPFNLSFVGTYRDLQRFIDRVHGFTSIEGDRVEVSGRLMSIDGVKLEGRADSARIKATVTATAYVAAPVAPVTAEGAAPAAGTAAAPAAAPQTASAPPTTPATVVAGG